MNLKHCGFVRWKKICLRFSRRIVNGLFSNSILNINLYQKCGFTSISVDVVTIRSKGLRDVIWAKDTQGINSSTAKQKVNCLRRGWKKVLIERFKKLESLERLLRVGLNKFGLISSFFDRVDHRWDGATMTC